VRIEKGTRRVDVGGINRRKKPRIYRAAGNVRMGREDNGAVG